MLQVIMLAELPEKAKWDAELTALFSRAAEYAEVYLLAKKRQKGCDGMGELATLKDEFSAVVDEVIGYCREKNYLTRDSTYDTDSIAEEFAGW